MPEKFEKENYIEKYKKIDKFQNKIDKFQILVDSQDKRLDLQLEIEGENYGKILLEELEFIQGAIYQEENYVKKYEILEELATLFEDVIPQETFEKMQNIANTEIPAQVLSKEQLDQLKEKAPAIFESVKSKLQEKPTQINDRWKNLLTNNGFSEEEFDKLKPYLSTLLKPIDKDEYLTEEKYKEIASYILEWREMLLKDPNFVTNLLSATYISMHHESFQGFKIWEAEYKENPNLVLTILKSYTTLESRKKLYEEVFLPNRNDFLSYKKYLLRIIENLSWTEYFHEKSLKFFTTDFFGKDKIFEKYFKKYPEAITEMIIIGKESFSLGKVMNCSLPLLEEELTNGPLSSKAKEYWEAALKIYWPGKTPKKQETFYQTIWPDIQAQPKLISKLGTFVSFLSTNLSEAYIIVKEAAFKRPDEFMTFFDDIEGRSSFIKTLWPYFDQEFKDHGYTENIKEKFKYLKGLSIFLNLTPETFSIIAKTYFTFPKETSEFLDQFGTIDVFVYTVFPIAREEIEKNGYTAKVKEYFRSAKLTFDKFEDRKIANVVLYELLPEIYEKGITPETSKLIHLLEKAAKKLKEYPEWYIREMIALLKHPKIKGLKSLIISSKNLAKDFDKFTKKLQKQKWFNEDFPEDRNIFMASSIKPNDIPFNKEKLKLVFWKANRSTEIITQDEKDPNTYEKLLTIPPFEFDKICYSEKFMETVKDFLKQKSAELTYMNLFSLVQAVYRRLQKKAEPINEQNIQKTTEEILRYREKVKEREIFGPKTKLILFTHEEERFDNENIIKNYYEKAGGTSANILCNVKGVKMENDKNIYKKELLDSIRSAKNGPVTLVFDGHGSKENWAFKENKPGELNNKISGDETTINYKELAEALYDSGNIRNFNIVGLTCYAYNYMQNVFEYLEKTKKTKDKPFISISSANLDRSAFGQISLKDFKSDDFLSALSKIQKAGPITLSDFIKAESYVMKVEDPAFFIPDEENNIIEIGENETKPLQNPLKAA